VLPSELLLLLAEVKRSCTREGCLPSVGGLLLFVLDLSNAGVQPELVLTTKGAPSKVDFNCLHRACFSKVESLGKKLKEIFISFLLLESPFLLL
jgi:hypothetical protein